jgi:hypothetical protein
MTTTKPFRLSRRTLLRGAGCALALPWLEAMSPRSARAQASAAPVRLFFFYVPNGIHMQGWTPSQEGSSFSLSPILAPLHNHKDDLLVLSGLRNNAAFANGDGGGDHARGTACFLTATRAVKTEGSNIRVGQSIDQAAAEHYAEATRFRSLELGCEGGGSSGGCDSGYSCAYVRNVSWRTPTQPAPKEVNPRSVFDRLFADVGADLTAQEMARKKRYKKSILDFVLDDAASLEGKLSARDRHKLDEYQTAVREVEVRVDSIHVAPQCQVGERPDGIPQQTTAYVDAMLDLAALAFECDLTRVVSFMLGNGSSGRSYGFLGVPGSHHELSHHQNDNGKKAQLQTINTWEVARLAHLLDRLQGAEEGGASLLDNSLVFFSSEVEDGNTHNHANLPVLLAGGGGGAVSPGRHLRYANSTPIANLFVSLLRAVGKPGVTSFGDDGTGPLPGLAG